MAIRLLHFSFGSSISSGWCLGTWWKNKGIELFNEPEILVEEGGNVILKMQCKDLSSDESAGNLEDRDIGLLTLGPKIGPNTL